MIQIKQEQISPVFFVQKNISFDFIQYLEINQIYIYQNHTKICLFANTHAFHYQNYSQYNYSIKFKSNKFMKLVKHLQKKSINVKTTKSIFYQPNESQHPQINYHRQITLLKLNSYEFQVILSFLQIADYHALYQFLQNLKDSKLHKVIISNSLMTLNRMISRQEQTSYINSFCRIRNIPTIAMIKFINISKKKEKNSDIIKQDVQRTYIKGHNSLSLKKFLVNVLSAISKEFPKIGYIQGFNYIIRVMYLNQFTQPQSFAFASYLLKQMKLQELYLNNMSKVFQYTYVLQVYLFNYVPELYRYLQQIDIDVIYFAANWFITLFAQQLPIRVLNKLWNVFLLKGWKIIIKFSISILFCYQNEIMKRSKECLSSYLKHFLETDLTKQKQEQIFKICMSIKVSNKMVSFFCNKMNLVQRDSQISLRKMRKNSIQIEQQYFQMSSTINKNKDVQESSCYWKNNRVKTYQVHSQSTNFFTFCESPSDVIV